MSDITIADCWGIDKVNKEFDDDKGCTTMILQSQKGVEVFNSIKEKLVISSYNIGSVYTNTTIHCETNRKSTGM